MTAIKYTSLVELITAHNIEVDWLLTWFPIRAGAALDGVRIRGGTFRHRNTDAVFAAGNQQTHMLGQGGGSATGDPLAHQNAVHAFITVGVSADRTFQADLEVVIGRSRRRQRLVLQPDTRTPFMMNVPAGGNDPIVQGTAVSFQGVFSASHRLGLVGTVVRLLGP
ncbi:MAG: hypothetical protein AB7R89_14195 [Dehalococcoidia bacterium]